MEALPELAQRIHDAADALHDAERNLDILVATAVAGVVRGAYPAATEITFDEEYQTGWLNPLAINGADGPLVRSIDLDLYIALSEHIRYFTDSAVRNVMSYRGDLVVLTLADHLSE